MMFLPLSQQLWSVGVSCCDVPQNIIIKFLKVVLQRHVRIIRAPYWSMEQFGSKYGLDEVDEMNMELLNMLVKSFKVW